jgi:hypothetical protein
MNLKLNKYNLPFIIFILAFTIRLFFNLYINPMYPYLTEDMGGYNIRANLLLTDPFSHNDYLAFFPPGTDIILVLIKLFFGKNNFTAIGIIYAALGAYSVVFAYLIAENISEYKLIPKLVAFLGVFNISHIIIGSYILSQTPYCFFMMASLWYLIKITDQIYNNKINNKDNFITGLLFGTTTLIRPDFLVFILLLFISLIIRCFLKSKKLNYKYLLYITCPFITCMLLASVKLYLHTDRYGFISENASYNLVFGRCHNIMFNNNINSLGNPPAFWSTSLEKLKPALDANLVYTNRPGDLKENLTLVKQCIAKTGWVQQINYSLTNMLFLWFSPLWPLYKLDYYIIYTERLYSNLFKVFFMLTSFISLGFLLVFFNKFKTNNQSSIKPSIKL